MKELSRREKTRVIVFAAISLLSVVLVVWFGWGICSSAAAMPIDYDDVGGVNIDGSDWTGFFLLTAGMLNGFLC